MQDYTQTKNTNIMHMSAEKPLAMAYVPIQQFTDLYENLNEGFTNGTIFKKLNKPFYGKKGGSDKQ